jgi:hypothetical protein
MATAASITNVNLNLFMEASGKSGGEFVWVADTLIDANAKS